MYYHTQSTTISAKEQRNCGATTSMASSQVQYMRSVTKDYDYVRTISGREESEYWLLLQPQSHQTDLQVVEY